MTVGFRADIGLLRLQAASFDRFLVPGSFGRIVVINNEEKEEEFSAQFENSVRSFYGRYASQVQLISRATLSLEYPGLFGWRRQQLLKWGYSRICKATHYVIVDSKNFLIKSWKPLDMRNENGKFSMMRRRFDENLLPSYQFIGCDAPEYVANIWTPFVFIMDEIKNCIEDISIQHKSDPYKLLADREKIFEFALYTANMLKRGNFVAEYDINAPTFMHGFWFNENENTDHILRSMESHTIKWSGIHRRFRNANPDAITKISEYLAKIELISSPENLREILFS